MMHRGLVLPDRANTDEAGVVTAPVTFEHPMRGYFQEWRRLMSADR